MSEYFVLHVVSFLIGAVPIGYLIGKIKGIDVRAKGSGNIGATNVARVAGKSAGAITLIGDIVKGVLGTCVVLITNSEEALSYVRFTELAASFGFFTILGHCYSPFLRFRGGKGVATSLGVFLSLAPLQALVATALFAVVVSTSKFVSLGSVTAALVMPILLWATGSPSATLQLMTVFAALLIAFRHRENLQRLANGTEPQFRAQT